MNNNKKLPSLRKHYLTLASVVIFLLLTGASTGSWYINNITRNSASTLILTKSITSTVQQLRQTLFRINMTVNALLINPESSHESIISKNLEQALVLISSLKSNTDLEDTKLELSVKHLHELIIELNTKTHFLTQNRKDSNWVYPALPYINNKTRIPNRDFTAAIESAINAYHNESIPIDETFFQLVSLRNHWQKKILNFRAVIIRFAGLNNSYQVSQEISIKEQQKKIYSLLNKLEEKKRQDLLELSTESSLNIMLKANIAWDKNWASVKALRRGTNWRQDVIYLSQYIIPLHKKINSAMSQLESSAYTWSLEQFESIAGAAKKVIIELWLLAMLAIGFVIIVYILIEKLVLQPTNRITQSLSITDDNYKIEIKDESSKEINQLTTAYNIMQKQIRQRQIALEHQAMHDALTSLPNRVLLNDRLTQAISIMKRAGGELAVLLLDLDRFKDVNDTLGHHIGDQLLQIAAERLKVSIRSSDTVARLGGDEFAIIAPQTNSDEAMEFAEKIIRSLNEIFIIEHNNIHVGVSIGISIYPKHGEDNHTLIRHADTAMYGAKYSNRSSLLYSPSQDKNTPDNLSLVSDLHHAVEASEEFSIHYQPQVNLKTSTVTQVEALFRWTHPKLGLIPTQDVIKLAEKTGVIQQLTIWVINTAIEEFMRYLADKNLHLSINLSTWNLQDPDLPDTINKLLKHHKMPPELLTLEITETAMMHDPVRARSVLRDLNELGIVLAIDDYGTGFSSLSYLKLLPVHELKIDKSFIFEMLENENDAIIVKSTIELAHNLGYKVTAEGVENIETLEKLQKHHCDTVQGYYISKPIGIHQLIIWLMKHQPEQ